MKAHKLTTNKLGTQLHCKTELKRILGDQSNHKKREQLLTFLIENDIFSPEEIELLRISINVSRIGVERYLSRDALLELLSNERVLPKRDLLLIDGGLLRERLASLADATSIEILCVNCSYYDLYYSLATLFEKKDLNINMKHYISISGSGHNTPTIINLVLPILFDNRYHLYKLESNYPDVSNSHGLAGNLISLLVKRGEESFEYFFIIKDHSSVYELPNPHSSNLFAFLSSILSASSKPPTKITEHLTDETTYEELLMRIFSLELNRVTYYLSPDICYMQIPVPIGLKAFNECDHFPPEVRTKLVDSAMSLHSQRHHNFYHKHKHNFSIISLNGCRSFLETGRSTDHFIGFRSFTIPERLEIFKLMIERARENSFYHQFVLKEHSFFSKYICVCYDQIGLLLCPYNTSYQIGNNTNMVILKTPELATLFADYYCDCLLTEQCYSREESIALLTDLYNEYCEKLDVTA